MKIEYKLDAFEGPLDLLLHLIEKNKVSIYDIPIVEITDQYLECVNNAEVDDLDVMSEFLVMAATLLSIKSRMLLPKPENPEEEVEDPREELVEKLLEYKMYKYISYELKDKEIDAGKALYKKPNIPKEVLDYEAPIDYDSLLDGVTLSKLNEIFTMVMQRNLDKIDPIRSNFGNIEQEEFNLTEKMNDVKAYVIKNKTCSFKKMLEGNHTKMNMIVSFLVILEMMKVGFITTTQDGVGEDIIITMTDLGEKALESLELTSIG